jgi:hypothetical protein
MLRLFMIVLLQLLACGIIDACALWQGHGARHAMISWRRSAKI